MLPGVQPRKKRLTFSPPPSPVKKAGELGILTTRPTFIIGVAGGTASGKVERVNH